MSALTARTEFAAALNQICAERGISLDAVLGTIEAALVAAYRKDFGLEEGMEYEAEIDPHTGKAKMFSYPEDEPEKKQEITPPGFGRIAAQTAKQVILQKIREAEKEAVLDEFSDKIGTIVNAMVLRFDRGFIVCDIGRGQGVMPPEEQIRSEHYRANQRIAVLIKDIRETYKGKQVVVSRADPDLVAKLFEREVPEVSSNAVEIKEIARDPGSRSKIAVSSTQSGVDPVGSCVGQKGVRVQAVINELGGEKIDIIQYYADPENFIIAALSPAEDVEVKLNKDKQLAKVTVPDDQVSLAIGRDGQNVRLASQLTGYKIEVVNSEGEKVTEKKADESPFSPLKLSTRAENALKKAGIESVKKLQELSDEELKEIKGIGPKTLKKINQQLKDLKKAKQSEKKE